jgi:hypothetical protein
MTASQRVELLTWDWRGQPDFDYLARLLRDVSGGTVHMAQADTGSDEYALVFSNEPITADQATAFYSTRWEGDE